MSDIFIPLQGPNGVRPKAPAVGAWQSPGYNGAVEIVKPHPDLWFGLRCDGIVVIDCDNEEAEKFWRDRTSGFYRTWERKTPRGVHFIYRWEPGCPEGPAVGVWPGIDIRAGRTSQIVFHAPGYYDLTPRESMTSFDADILTYGGVPAQLGKHGERHADDESWDEVPDGRGNNTMTAFAGAFRKQGMSPQRIARCLGAINRICMTRDPMPNQMIADITMSVCRYAPKPDIDIEAVE